MRIRERYHNDPVFHQLVDMIRAVIEDGTTTPTEIREAAMLAQIMYEETHVRPMIFTRDNVIKERV